MRNEVYVPHDIKANLIKNNYQKIMENIEKKNYSNADFNRGMGSFWFDVTIGDIDFCLHYSISDLSICDGAWMIICNVRIGFRNFKNSFFNKSEEGFMCKNILEKIRKEILIPEHTKEMKKIDDCGFKNPAIR